MKGIVWYKIKSFGKVKFEEIISYYRTLKIEINKFQVRDDEARVYFKNGDIWYLIKAETGRCLGRCNVSYIDENIDLEYIEAVIKPCTSLLPYTAYNYY